MLSRLSHISSSAGTTCSHLQSPWSIVSSSQRLAAPPRDVPTSFHAPIQSARRSYYRFQVHNDIVTRWTTNHTLQRWINERIQLFQPSAVHLCDGSEEENERLIHKQIQLGTLVKLNDRIRPNSYLARSSKSDTARVEDATFICSNSKIGAGPTNNWEDPEKMHLKMEQLFAGSMRGRTMYVVPFAMGPQHSPFAMYGVQVTDSPYVVCSMRVMTRMGEQILAELSSEEEHNWVPCVHSVGHPLLPHEDTPDAPWPCNQSDKYIVHFPEERRIWSYGSGYGGNAILGKKCLALRLGSFIAHEEGWLAEHMLVIGVTNPDGVKKYFLGCFPSACGKTNLAMLQCSLSTMEASSRWKVECVGDDIAWIRKGPDGRLYAVNPENGFFGVAPGTSKDNNVNAMRMIESNTLFTNVAMTESGDVWWEGMSREPPSEGLIGWNRHEVSSSSLTPAAHPNARFCVGIEQCPVLDAEYANPNGVPISGILFGGRRSTTIPLVYQCFDWNHGVFTGSTMSSETTAAAAGLRGVLRLDPFSMRPFCGYNMSDYFRHWLSFGEEGDADKLPRMFMVNWFRKDKGRILWPGFSENLRVIKWVFDRCGKKEGDERGAKKTPIGFVPDHRDPAAFDTSNLLGSGHHKIDQQTLDKIFAVEPKDFLKDIQMFHEFYRTFDDSKKIPKALEDQLKGLEERINEEVAQKVAK